MKVIETEYVVCAYFKPVGKFVNTVTIKQMEKQIEAMFEMGAERIEIQVYKVIKKDNLI